MPRLRSLNIHPLHIFASLFVLLLMSVVVVYIFAFGYAVPVAEVWKQNYDVAVNTVDQTLTFDDLVPYSSGHRTVWTNLTTLVLTVTTNWNIRVEQLFNVGLAVILLVLLVHVFQRTSGLSGLWVVLPFALLIFAINKDNIWLRSRYNHWHFALVFFAAGLFWLSRHQVRWRDLLLALAATIAGTFSMAIGLLSWLVLPVLLLLWRVNRWRYFLVWLVAAVICIGVYFAGIDFDAGNQWDRPESVTPVYLIEFTIAYLGTAFRPSISFSGVPPYAPLLGWSAVIALSLNLFFAFRAGLNFRPYVPWLGVSAYVVGSAALAGIGRTFQGIAAAGKSQYVSTSTLFWIALIAVMMILAHQSRDLKHTQRRMARFLMGLNVLMCVAMAAAYVNAAVTTWNKKETDIGEPWYTALTNHAPYERCVLAYPFTREPECTPHTRLIAEEAERTDSLAHHGLTLFAEQPERSVLPSDYRQGDPIIVETRSAWLTVHINDWLLPDSTADVRLQLLPEREAELPAALPGTTLIVSEGSADAQIEAFIGDSERVWLVTDGEIAEAQNSVHRLIVQRYYPLMTGQPVDAVGLTLTGFARVPLATPGYTFNTDIHLHGWTLVTPQVVDACSSVTVASFWSLESPVDFNYSLTLVLADADGVGRASSDGSPADTLMGLWNTDQIYVDARTLRVPCDAPGGDYNLLVGLYNYETGVNLPVSHTDGGPVGELAYITTISVE